MKQIRPDLHQIPLGVTNVFLLRDAGNTILIDAGPPGEDEAFLSALKQLDVAPTAIDHIVMTHAHRDHAGALQAVKAATGAPVWMHAADAELVENGRARREWSISPGPLQHVLYWLYVHGKPDANPPVEIEHTITEEQDLPGSLRTLHVPGHCEGQIALLWPKHGGVLFAADTALFLWGRPRLSVVYEDLEQGREDLRRLGRLEFDTAVFSHGAPILKNAADLFQQTFG